MPITVAHGPNQSSVVLTFTDEWTWHESLSALKHAIAIANQIGRRVSFVFDLSRNSFMPPTGLLQTLQDGVELAQNCAYIDVCILVFNKSQSQLRAMIATAVERSGAYCEMLYVNSLNEAFEMAHR